MLMSRKYIVCSMYQPNTIANAATHDEPICGRVVEWQSGVDDVAPAESAHVEAAAHEEVARVLERHRLRQPRRARREDEHHEVAHARPLSLHRSRGAAGYPLHHVDGAR